MAVKKKTEKQTGSWIGEVEKYSRQIWLAGLGAYSKVSKDGSKLFDTLVKDGEKAEKAAKSGDAKQADALKASVESSSGTTRSRVEEAKDRAIGKWGELEEAFDKRLNSAISRLGVPSRNEVKALNDKVELLTRQLEALTGVSSKATVKKAAAKPATATRGTASSKTASTAAAKPVATPVAAKTSATKKAPASKAVAAKPAAAARSPVKPAAKTAAKPAVKSAAKSAGKPAAKKPAATKATTTAPTTPVTTPGTATTNASGTQS
jgi:poly(hydroxyalkanoate) granule-associated protein|nr:phasin family protein [Pseudomonas sp.]